MIAEFTIEGLSCGHCVSAVSTIIKNINGVKSCKVVLPNKASVEFDELQTSLDLIKSEINSSEIYKAI
ncbi:MAG: heavy-metal-associated domain-containing protein [Flavobacteriales bacterium]|nr:heavy-metal-associated domain-containing protein [Flavobacteriales bacterium]